MTEYNIKEFKDILASAEPVPGGGGASAYVASLGMALGTMVANLTTGKKKYAQYQEEIEQAIAQSEKISDELIEFIKKSSLNEAAHLLILRLYIQYRFGCLIQVFL